MSRNNKSGGGFNKFLNFIGIVDDNRPQSAPNQSFNSGSGYGQPEAYTPGNRQRTDARSSARTPARRSIPAQASRSNPGTRRAYEDDPRYGASKRPSRFDEDSQQGYAPQQRSRSRFDEDDSSFQPERSEARPAAPRTAVRSSGHTVTCTLYTLTDVNPVIKALVRGDSIYVSLHTDEHMERRILDTLSGAVYALDAQIRQPSKEFKTFILAPKSVNIQNIQDMDD